MITCQNITYQLSVYEVITPLPSWRSSPQQRVDIIFTVVLVIMKKMHLFGKLNERLHELVHINFLIKTFFEMSATFFFYFFTRERLSSLTS